MATIETDETTARIQHVERMTAAFLRIADGTAAAGRAAPGDVALALFAAACGKLTETFGESDAAAHLELMAAHCREMGVPQPEPEPKTAEAWRRFASLH